MRGEAKPHFYVKSNSECLIRKMNILASGLCADKSRIIAIYLTSTFARHMNIISNISICIVYFSRFINIERILIALKQYYITKAERPLSPDTFVDLLSFTVHKKCRKNSVKKKKIVLYIFTMYFFSPSPPR